MSAKQTCAASSCTCSCKRGYAPVAPNGTPFWRFADDNPAAVRRNMVVVAHSEIRTEFDQWLPPCGKRMSEGAAWRWLYRKGWRIHPCELSTWPN